jgi:hypothetical protein
MKHEDFFVGLEFRSTWRSQPYVCTDIGERVIVAMIVPEGMDRTELSNYIEFVFNEREIIRCSPMREKPADDWTF